MMNRSVCRGTLVLCLAVVSAAVFSWPVNAAGACGTREALLSSLSNRYKEVPQAFGITYRGELIELLVSPGGTSWSLVVTSPGGPSCLVTAGEGWRVRPSQQSKAAAFDRERDNPLD